MIITSSLVYELRNRTDEPLMRCKRALQACGGDMDKAEEYIRVNYRKSDEVLAEREACARLLEAMREKSNNPLFRSACTIGAANIRARGQNENA